MKYKLQLYFTRYSGYYKDFDQKEIDFLFLEGETLFPLEIKRMFIRHMQMKKAVTPSAHNNREEKSSMMAQLKKYEKEIKAASLPQKKPRSKDWER